MFSQLQSRTFALAAAIFIPISLSNTYACDQCGCQDGEDGVCSPTSHSHSHSHDDHGHSHSHASSDVSLFTSNTGSPQPAGMNAPVKFAVIGDTQGGEFGGHSNLLTRLMESVNTHNVDYVLFPGDLVGDSGSSGWSAWVTRTSILGTNSMGRDKRLMTPGNHDRGSGGNFANWQSTFNWLPDSQVHGGLKGIDQVDYYLDHGNVRFISVSTDAPGQIYNGRAIDQAPPALAWMREVMKDVDARNADENPDNNIDHVFTFSHRPVTTQNESPTGGTNGAWWESMTGQDSASGDHIATAFLPGHWHMYQPSRPDPDVDTMEIISGTGGGGLEGQAHRNRHGYSIISIEGETVTSEFYGDFNQGSDNWNFQLLDSYTVAQAGGLPTGELARYEFTARTAIFDNSNSALSKQHVLQFHGGAIAVLDAEQGGVLQLSGGGYADAKAIGDNNLAVLGDLTISLSAKADALNAGENTLVTFGGADGSSNGDLLNQESANHIYKFSMIEGGKLALSWQHDDAEWQTVTSSASVADPSLWHEYTVQRDGDNRGVAFFVDGEQLGDAFATDFLPTGGGSGSLYIGAGVGGVDSFDGWIDNVRIDSSPVSLTPTILGDFDRDGDIDGADWTLFAAELGSMSPTNTDLTGDGVNDYDDFLAFKSRFEDFNGLGTFAQLFDSVPESSTIALLGLAIATGVLRRRRTNC